MKPSGTERRVPGWSVMLVVAVLVGIVAWVILQGPRR